MAEIGSKGFRRRGNKNLLFGKNKDFFLAGFVVFLFGRLCNI
jgi:hypothetical protein